jgi:type I restriction enzyme S subunit
MNSDWPQFSFEQLKAPGKSAFAMGPFGSNIKAENFTTSGVPVIKGGNLNGTYINENFNDFLSEEKAAELASSQAHHLDVVITHRGTLGQVGIIPENSKYSVYVVSQSQLKLTFDKSKVDPYFIYYFLISPLGQQRLLENTSQVGVPAIAQALTTIRKIQVSLPNLSEQSHICSILRSIDDQITLLRETNETLEAIAQAIFKSWFVDFDPVKAKAAGLAPSGIDEATADLFSDSFQESELGPIPDGWSVGKLGDFCQNVRVQAKPGNIPSGTAYFGLEHMPRKSIALESWGQADHVESNKFAFKKDDVLFGKLRPYFHKVGLAPCEGVCSTDILVLRPSIKEALGFLAMHASSVKLIDYTTQLSNGARMPRTSWADVEGFAIPSPPFKIVQSFGSVVRPMFDSIFENIEEIKTLSELRDTLLPRLISGKLRIPETQEAVEEMA